MQTGCFTQPIEDGLFIMSWRNPRQVIDEDFQLIVMPNPGVFRMHGYPGHTSPINYYRNY